jgi:CubicO group peptidase (beta-lactamase class C family)
MARFLIMHLNGGKSGGKQILSAASVKKMGTVQFDKPPGRFGLGWVVSASGSRPFLWHNGAVWGFGSYMRIDPKNRLGVVLFANKWLLPDDPLPDLGELALALLDKLEPTTGRK